MATRNIVPRATGEGQIGTSAKTWGAGYFNDIAVTNGVTASTFTGDLTGDVTGNVTGNLTGNVTGNADTATNATNATNDGNGDEIASTYLPLAGGTMNGAITTTALPAIKSPSNADQITIVGGSDTWSSDGAKLILNGGTRSSNAGEFTVQAGNGNGYKQLVGKPNGGFTWGGSNIAVMGTLQNGHGILTGTVTGISVSANSYKSASVNFGQTFASAPKVVVCSGAGHAHVSASINNASTTTTSFTYTVSNETSSSFTNEVVMWIAIG